ncbi:MAG: metallophosphoesterase [Deltaproteobacteria bacterium]|nr:metallophosphoesterase [Deltaproteobacteria bacterium]
MQLITKAIPRTHKIYLFGDTHEGTILKHKSGIAKMIEMILSEPHSYAIHMGDMVEGRNVDDSKYDIDTVDPKSKTVFKQYKNAVAELKPIAHRMITQLFGNHDDMAGRGEDLVRDYVCPELGIPYGTFSSVISMVDTKGKLMYKIHATHGRRNIGSNSPDPLRKEANELMQLQAHMGPIMSDCAIHVKGHTHKLRVKKPIHELCITSLDSKKRKRINQGYTTTDQTAEYIPKDLRWYVNSGCFYKLYELGVSGYAEKAEYPPNELGFAIVHVERGKIKDITREMI